jgi:hypothetical protein
LAELEQLAQNAVHPSAGWSDLETFDDAFTPAVVLALTQVAHVAYDGHDADIHEPRPEADGPRIPGCPLCDALAALTAAMETK